MYCCHQYLSIDPKKFVTPSLTPTGRQQTSKSRKYETIKDSEMGSQIFNLALLLAYLHFLWSH